MPEASARRLTEEGSPPKRPGASCGSCPMPAPRAPGAPGRAHPQSRVRSSQEARRAELDERNAERVAAAAAPARSS